jgi:2-keto-4-pentenoate hydratase/2-oxohepta-3-ene-1,7-dioic acid hydratase in catechol pathway
MRLARARTPSGVITGRYEDEAVHTEDGTQYILEGEAELLAPCEPSTLYCAGRNYQDYLKQKHHERPEQPHFFLKPPAAVWPPDSTIPYPEFAEGVGYAGELAAVIDRDCSDLAPEDVPEVVRGYTVMNDVDAIGEPGAAKKVFTGAAPLGPWIETDVDPVGLDLQTTVGGEVRQKSNTTEMLFDPYDIVAFLSERVTLQAGDVVAFGSPANPGEIMPGDEIEIFYEGIGKLKNTLGRPE